MLFRREILRMIPGLGLMAALATPSIADAQEALGVEDALIARGNAYLQKNAANTNVGEAALGALAMLKGDVPPNDPAMTAILRKVLARFQGGTYRPENDGGSGLYETAIVSMVLANVDPITYREPLAIVAQTLTRRQLPNGGWDYSHRDKGDTSISQYAVLGLWEAANGGALVPPEIWDRAASWYLGVQSDAGSWNYHRDESGPETIAMTAAGVGSLLICQMQLQQHLKAIEPPSSLLQPIYPEGMSHYEPRVSNRRLEDGARRGIAWLSARFRIADGDPMMGQTPFYALYGIERVGALGGRERLGALDWYRQGVRFIGAKQGQDGSWSANYGTVPNTAWALLFLTRATAKSVKKIEIKRLSAGTLLGGRGLPRDLSTLTVAGGRVMVRPMNGAIDGMLAVLEDPRAEDVGSALAGLVEQYHRRGPAVLRPLKDRFRKLLAEGDPAGRSIAAWALGRLGDLDAALPLIQALEDPDDGVVREARLGLQALARKLDGPGPPEGATAEQKAEADRRWRAWYDNVRPPGFDADAPASPARSTR